MSKQRITSKKLVPGMKLADPVYNAASQLIFPRGTILTEEYITKLAFYNITYTFVEADDDMTLKKEDVFDNVTYLQRVRSTPEFKLFNKQFNETTVRMKFALDEIVAGHGNSKMVQNLVKSAQNLVNVSSNSLEVMDMLHSMRDMDDLTYVHSLNVSIISGIIGRWIHMSEEDLTALTSAALLHDIGKLTIPADILLKPGRLTNEEYTVMKMHAENGYHLLKKNALDERIPLAAWQHHERRNGTGYPSRLVGDQISYFARIIAIADVYDAMTAARVYRGPLCPFEVISTFESDGYQIYDPSILVPFMHNVVDSYVNNTVQLSNSKRGKICMINRNSLSRPIVSCDDNTYIDLSKNREIRIAAIL